ncbi:MAG: DUF362 domain-containing protein [Candidatus Aminicenantes bacterium]|nr:DUF362 domain-containing protein [Candidatus Aminicenantes bacterium]
MAKPKVIVVRVRGILERSGDIDPARLRRAYERGIRALTGAASLDEGLGRLFRPSDRVGLKINTIGGRKISTRPEVALGLAAAFKGTGVPDKSILIWDRTNRELRDAGYALSLGSSGVKIYGTDTDGAGYEDELYAKGNIGSLFASIQSRFATASVSLALLKDHGLAGVTAGMKNYFGAIHNPNKYHDDHCDPFVAEVFAAPPVATKHRLTVLDALLVQYHRGPAYHAQWADRAETLVFGTDPVATDAVGWRMIEALRAAHGLPTLAEEGREPRYLATAERMGLGRGGSDAVEVVEEEA